MHGTLWGSKGAYPIHSAAVLGNFAWNVRRISTSEYASLTDAKFNEWGKYPAEIEQLRMTDDMVSANLVLQDVHSLLC
jgi:hypothetical protein